MDPKYGLIEFLTHPTVVVAVFLGASALLLGYILRLFRNVDRDGKIKSEQLPALAEKKPFSKPHKKKPSSDTAATNKWSNRGENSPPWLLSTLKGHTGPVLNIDYSPNGKFLASCGEEDPDPDGTNTSSGSDCKDISPMATPPPSTKGLSRRQRKNRRREDSSPDSKKKTKNTQDNATRNKKQNAVPLKQCLKLNVTERYFADLLHSHLLTPEQLYSHGYPVQSTIYNNEVVFLSHLPRTVPTRSKFDVNAREFIPNSKPYEESSSDSSEIDSEESESDLMYYAKKKCTADDQGVERTCARCGSGFFITKTEYLTQERCNYHWGKLQYVHKGDKKHGIDSLAQYSCCLGKSGSPGCTTSKLHVWTGVVNGVNGPYQGYVKTPKKRSIPPDGNYGVYALDCEMSFTVAGLECTKVTVVAMDGRLVYDTYVRPINEIIDYNTRFSGITAKDLAKPGATKTLREVQNDLRGFINANTILIGHGLENDLRALKLLHRNVVDTALSFPHYHGFPYKRSLRSLVSTYLKREVQSDPNGHNSYEDACACMELMLYKVRKENKNLLC